MTRFTSRLAIAAVTFGLIGGFGPGLMQPAFASKAGGHEATEHSGKDSADNGTDKSGSTEKSSVDKGDRNKETETETSDASDK
jgi:hypothetical protein